MGYGCWPKGEIVIPGNWLDNFRQGGAQGLVFEPDKGFPPVLKACN